VHNPTVRLREGQDYDVKAGSVLSSFDLLASRGPDDDQPGVWWCPVVLFDEHFLSKNFGSLVGDVRDSTISYQQELLASYALRFTGPLFQNTAWTLAALLGSPIFTQDGTVVSTNQTIIGYRVTVGNSDAQQVAFIPSGTTPLTVGINVVPTQSLSQAPIFNGAMQSFISLENSVLTLQLAIRPQAGDVIKFSIVNPADPAQTPIPFTSRVVSSDVNANGLLPYTQIVMRDAPRYNPLPTASLLILRQGNPPYATISGTVLSIQPVYETVVRTTLETFTLPEGVAAEQRVGDHIFRGMPLFPSYADLYDSTTRPNWHWITPSDVLKNYNHKINKYGSNVTVGAIIDYRTAVVSPATSMSSYSLMVMSPQAPVPPRGSKITLTDTTTKDVFQFTVVGAYGSGVYVTPPVSIEKAGDISVTIPPVAGLVDFFEAPSPPQNALIETIQTYPQLVRSSSLQVVSTAMFPAAGRVAVRLPNGGATEFTYTSVSDGFFLNCVWPADFPALTGVSGNLDPLLPLTSVFRLVSAFTTRRINPAFVALVNERVTQDLSNSTPTVVVTEKNIEALYALTKTGATVFESRAVTHPAALDDVLVNLMPTTTSMIALSKHVIVDVFAGGANEN
jgi:hypothetical protein